MNLRFRLLIICAVGLVAVAVYTFPTWSIYFMGEVEEATSPFVDLPPDLQTAFAALPEQQQDEYLRMQADNPALALALVTAALAPDSPAPESELTNIGEPPIILRSGSLNRVDDIHAASGTMTIYQLPDDSRVLRLENFRVTNGPQLHVILTRNLDPVPEEGPSEGLGNYVDLGLLLGNVGDQDYSVPADTDLDQYRTVVIYSVPYGVVFSAGSLD